MKCEIVKSEPKQTLPKVGDYFVFKDNVSVWRRVEDWAGESVAKNISHLFFAEQVSSGFIFSISNPNIILLEQVEPAKFKVKE